MPSRSRIGAAAAATRRAAGDRLDRARAEPHDAARAAGRRRIRADRRARPRRARWLAPGALRSRGAAVGRCRSPASIPAAGGFFGAGALVLVGGLALVRIADRPRTPVGSLAATAHREPCPRSACATPRGGRAAA